ncbi:unnamed protein product, partial [Citrullus colocynthis]
MAATPNSNGMRLQITTTPSGDGDGDGNGKCISMLSGNIEWMQQREASSVQQRLAE